MAEKPSLYKNVTEQVDKAADLMGLNPDIRKILSKPTNEIVVNFPVNGSINAASPKCPSAGTRDLWIAVLPNVCKRLKNR